MSLPGYLNTMDWEPVNQFGHLYYKTEVLGTIAETPASGGKEGGSMNQTTSTSEWKTRRDHMEADVYQTLTGVSSEGLGLIKLFLINTNNINNHSVNLDNHKSDFEPGLVPKWDRCYVCWLVLSCHMVLQCALAKQSVFQYLPLIDFSWLHITWCVQSFTVSPNTTVGT